MLTFFNVDAVVSMDGGHHWTVNDKTANCRYHPLASIMYILRSLLATASLLTLYSFSISNVLRVNAFVPYPSTRIPRLFVPSVPLMAIENGGDVASMKDNNGKNHEDGRLLVQNLRSSQVTNMNGQLVHLDVAMGKGTSVVVFLRHLG